MDGHGTIFYSSLPQHTLGAHMRMIQQKLRTRDSRAVSDLEKQFQHKFLSPLWFSNLTSPKVERKIKSNRPSWRQGVKYQLPSLFLVMTLNKYLFIWTITNSLHFSCKQSKVNCHLWNVDKAKYLPIIILFPCWYFFIVYLFYTFVPDFTLNTPRKNLLVIEQDGLMIWIVPPLWRNYSEEKAVWSSSCLKEGTRKLEVLNLKPALKCISCVAISK